jgi:hypothetical protein
MWATLRFRTLIPDPDIVIAIRHTDQDLDEINMKKKYRTNEEHCTFDEVEN